MQEVGGSIPPGSTTLRLRLRVAQPRSRKRSVPGIAQRATTGWKRNVTFLGLPAIWEFFGYAWRSHVAESEACPAFSPMGDDGLETQRDVPRSACHLGILRLRVAQPRNRKRSVPGIAPWATTSWKRNVTYLVWAAYMVRLHHPQRQRPRPGIHRRHGRPEAADVGPQCRQVHAHGKIQALGIDLVLRFSGQVPSAGIRKIPQIPLRPGIREKTSLMIPYACDDGLPPTSAPSRARSTSRRLLLQGGVEFVAKRDEIVFHHHQFTG
jgi:hypothetical protein